MARDLGDGASGQPDLTRSSRATTSTFTDGRRFEPASRSDRVRASVADSFSIVVIVALPLNVYLALSRGDPLTLARGWWLLIALVVVDALYEIPQVAQT